MKWIRKRVTDGYVKRGLPGQSFFLWLSMVSIFYVSKPFRITCLLQQAVTQGEAVNPLRL